MCVAENMTFFQRYIPCYVSVKKYAKRHILQPTCLSWRGHQQHKEKAVHTVCRALAATPTSAVHKTRLRRKMSEGQFRREKKQTPSPSAFAPHAQRPRSSSTTRGRHRLLRLVLFPFFFVRLTLGSTTEHRLLHRRCCRRLHPRN